MSIQARLVVAGRVAALRVNDLLSEPIPTSPELQEHYAYYAYEDCVGVRSYPNSKEEGEAIIITLLPSVRVLDSVELFDELVGPGVADIRKYTIHGMHLARSLNKAQSAGEVGKTEFHLSEWEFKKIRDRLWAYRSEHEPLFFDGDAEYSLFDGNYRRI